MRPEDEESREADNQQAAHPGDGAGRQAGEHSVPPATWAARQRAAEAEDGEPGDVRSADGAEEVEADAATGEGFTAEFDRIERDLDRELEGLGSSADADGDEPEAEEPPAEVPGESEVPDADEPDVGPEEPEADEPDVGPEEPEAAEPPAVDREQASETALAALRARSAGGGWEAVPAANAGKPADPAAVGEAPRAKPVWARFAAASVIIVASIATAFAVSALVFVAEIAEGLGGIDGVEEQLDDVEGGDPQTILFLGSDIRPTDDTGRSDTTLLLRVDPDAHSINLMSIPRDLKVTIPNHGIDKFNAAYSYGGPKLTLRVVKQLTGLPVNHVVNINFTGFADAVNSIDCVFIDVDRRYYVPEGSEYSAIDPPIEAGYQRLCGLKALQYVRYRLEDNDLVRAARQQDFVREARQKIEPSKLIADPNYRYELLDVFKEYTTSDSNLRDTAEVLDLMKTFLSAHDAVLNEIQFPAQLGESYVTAGNAEIRKAVAEFLNEAPAPAESTAETAETGETGGGGGTRRQGGGRDKPAAEPDGPPMDDATGQTETYASQITKVRTRGGDPMVEFPVFYPALLAPGSIVSNDTRAFPLDGPKEYRGYKIVVTKEGENNGLTTEYYGVSGTNWTDPPILENPSETRAIEGRDYLLFYDADRLRLIGWRTKKASYWLSNTLLQSLDEAEMIAIATSMRELGG